MNKKYEDKELIGLLKSSDQTVVNQALRYLFREYRKFILALLRSRSLPTEDAKEVFNESMFALVKNAQKGLLDTPDAQIKPYLIAICRKKAASKFNVKMHFVDIEKTSVRQIAIEKNPLDFLLSQEKTTLVQSLLEKLGANCKTIILGFYFHQQRMEDLAVQLNYANEQIVRNKKVKCMKKLKELVKKSSFYQKNLRE